MTDNVPPGTTTPAGHFDSRSRVGPPEEPGSGSRGSRKRGSWTILDQSVSSLTNFALSYLVLRTAGVAGFGAFTVAYITYAVVLNIMRALVCEPLVVRHTTTDSEEPKHAIRAATGAAIAIGILAAATVGGAALVAGNGPVAGMLGVLSLVLPGLLLQDAWRFVFFSLGKPARAFQNDLFWGLALALTIVALWHIRGGAPPVEALILVWGLTGTLAGLLGTLQTGIVPAPFATKEWMTSNRALGFRFVAEYALQSSASQLSLFLIGVMSGLVALGSLNGARVLFGPINVLFLGMVAFAVPEGVRVRRRAPHELPRFIYRLGTVLALVSIAVGTTLLLLPAAYGERLVPAGWDQVRTYVPPVTLWVTAAAGVYAGRIGLRVYAAASASLRTQLVTATIVVLGTVVGAYFGGGVGAATGMAVANVVGAIIWLSAFRIVGRRLH